MVPKLKLLDCTLRDGGYYNSWDFDPELIVSYLRAMDAIKVDYVEFGFRFLENEECLGGCAHTPDFYISSFSPPESMKIGVMLNASDIVNWEMSMEDCIEVLFPSNASESPVSLVRVACHFKDFLKALPISRLLKDKGYMVGFNIMQIGERNEEEITHAAKSASDYPLDVLYFADSLGNLTPARTREIIRWIKKGWSGEIGIHTHDNMGKAMANTLTAIEEGVSWIDGTVTGMGRGPGNAHTEFLVLATEEMRGREINVMPLFECIRKYFNPLKNEYGWGTNPYYYLAGRHGIHPSYIQKMIDDNRYDEEDILAVINHLKETDARSFRLETLESARHFYSGKPRGAWKPAEDLKGREVLILGTGPGLDQHREALMHFIEVHKPFVIALNAKDSLPAHCINARAACHPVRLLADTEEHLQHPQPLITPRGMMPEDVLISLKDKKLLDYGLVVRENEFFFEESYAGIPGTFVTAYALAVATSGKARKIYLAGFDGYEPGDPRQFESQHIFDVYINNPGAIEIKAITPTSYNIDSCSVYGVTQ